MTWNTTMCDQQVEVTLSSQLTFRICPCEDSIVAFIGEEEKRTYTGTLSEEARNALANGSFQAGCKVFQNAHSIKILGRVESDSFISHPSTGQSEHSPLLFKPVDISWQEVPMTKVEAIKPVSRLDEFRII